MTDVPQTAVLLFTAKYVLIWPNAAYSKVYSNKGWLLFVCTLYLLSLYHTFFKQMAAFVFYMKHTVCHLIIVSCSCCSHHMVIRGKKHHTIVHFSLCLISACLPSSHLSLTLSVPIELAFSQAFWLPVWQDVNY